MLGKVSWDTKSVRARHGSGCCGEEDSGRAWRWVEGWNITRNGNFLYWNHNLAMNTNDQKESDRAMNKLQSARGFWRGLVISDWLEECELPGRKVLWAKPEALKHFDKWKEKHFWNGNFIFGCRIGGHTIILRVSPFVVLYVKSCIMMRSILYVWNLYFKAFVSALFWI